MLCGMATAILTEGLPFLPRLLRRTFGCLQAMLLLDYLQVCSVLSIVSRAGPPILSLSTGMHTGAVDSDGLQTFFGIRYAQPPVGDLRFRHAMSLASSPHANHDATQFGATCVQTPARDDQNEDCLFLNIWKPENVTDEPLPILIWLHGGAFQIGTIVSGHANSTTLILKPGSANDRGPTVLMKRSLQIGKPFIFVAINYRLGPYGFLASESMEPTDLNAGLSDQQEAFRFIKANARALGADPHRITIWGQSSGASSVSLHWLFSSPREQLFSAVIMDSGGPTTYPQADPAAFDLTTGAFSQLVALAGCDGPHRLECLRRMPFAELYNATNTLLQRARADPTYTAFPPVLDGIFIRQRCSHAMRARRMLPLPIIVGGPTDDGTLFTLNSTNSTADINRMVTSVLNPPTFSSSPFGTGNDTFELSPQWKRAAAIYGDWKFNSAKRYVLRSATGRSYGFTWDIAANGTLPFRGVPHGAELEVSLFGPGTGPYGPTVLNVDASQTLLDGYLQFISDRVPRLANGDPWPEYSERGEIIIFDAGSVTALKDIVRHEQIEFFISHFDGFLK